LIAFSCFNNLLGGAFMALMDPYGLSLMSVQGWGLLWGGLSAGFIVGGLAVAKTGLGRNPLRLLLGVNLILWGVTCVFPLRSSIVLLAGGMAAYLVLIPYAEAAEQTILQRVVPYERQGSGLRLRPEHRAGRVAADGLSDRADHPVDLHPVHDHRRRRRTDR
jgi:DHA3 family multidrug efflux protein-like MFS transporter